MLSQIVPTLTRSVIIGNENITFNLRKSATSTFPVFLKFFEAFPWGLGLPFLSLSDLTAVDRLTDVRFTLIYNFLLVKNNNLLKRFFLTFAVDEFMPVETLHPKYMSALWLERETHDMFGIIFTNTDSRRILTDYGFEGYPLRKDFPLSGYSEVVYSLDKKKIEIKSLELSQEFRYFDFTNPWIYPVI